MLLSLAIRDFVLIEDAALDFADGLTVLTGETGAGKTLLTRALGLLLGERAEEGQVAPHADEALIQGIFEVSADHLEALPADLVQSVGLEVGEVIATRRLARTGKNRCFLNGVGVPLSALESALGGLVSFSSQHEHRRLLDAGNQLVVLDRFAGAEQAGDLAEYAEAWSRLRDSVARRDQARGAATERARELAHLREQVYELEAARLDVAEEEALREEQLLLARAEEVAAACFEAAALIRADANTPDIVGLASAARGRLSGVVDADRGLRSLTSELEDAIETLLDTARGLRAFADRLEMRPERLAEVDERLRVYADIARRYGGSTEAATARLLEASDRLRELEEEEDDAGALDARISELEAQCLRVAARLSTRRTAAAAAVAAQVTPELRSLGLPGGGLEVSVTASPGLAGLGRTGCDEVAFLFSADRGAPPRPLARVASGGELSRVLLALKTVLRDADAAETLVFDEIDAGIGGHTATAVGARLRAISRANRSVVVTHLPQVAAFADRHVLIAKEESDGRPVTRLRVLDEEGALAELSRMMGGRPDDPGSLEHARALRSRALAGLVD